MTIDAVRGELQGIIEHADDPEEVVRRAQHALDEIDAGRLLTTTEAASLLLGIRSVNTLKLLCRRGLLAYTTRGNRIMIPPSEVERAQQHPVVGVCEPPMRRTTQRLRSARPKASRLSRWKISRPLALGVFRGKRGRLGGSDCGPSPSGRDCGPEGPGGAMRPSP